MSTGTITFEYREIEHLPLDWSTPRGWPGPGVYRVMTSLNGRDLYFVSTYNVEIAFDAFDIGVVEGDITQEVAEMAENAIIKAMGNKQ